MGSSRATCKSSEEKSCFYEGTEFTKEVYQEFFLDTATHVFVCEMNNRYIGVIEVNEGTSSFLSKQISTRNVGDIFLTEAYRGKGLAEELLFYAISVMVKQGIQNFWVEHGTANPNARGFWNKYFQTYSYSMIRDIKPINI